jgi:hypothetical protein
MYRDESPIKPAACPEYEALLKRSHAALSAWKNGRTEIRRSGRTGRAVDNELRILQANFAKAYAALQTHARDCVDCQIPAGYLRSPDSVHDWLHQ